jgi:ubiquinone/menaquinone biosynthesis C-methylase UbiE
MKPKKQQQSKSKSFTDKSAKDSRRAKDSISHSSQKETSWGGVAFWYDEYLKHEDTYQSKVIWPNLERIIFDTPKTAVHGGLKSLGGTAKTKLCDIACGQGYFAHLYSQKGYDVIGVDISKELISFARQAVGNSAPPPYPQTQISKHDSVSDISVPEFHVAPSHDMSIVPNASMDIVTCVLALQNIKLLDETFQEAARILKKGGRFIFVLNHPSFRIPQFSDWIYDQKKQVESRTVAKYLQEATIKIDMNPGESREIKKVYTVSFHRPLQTFIKLLAKHGYVVKRLEEWASHKRVAEGPQRDALNQAKKEIPMFMCIEAVKAV